MVAATPLFTSIRDQRFSRRTQDCPVCGGNADDPQGKGVRCWGIMALDGRSAICTRPEYAGALQPDKLGHYRHSLTGDCACGQEHGALDADVVQRLERKATSSAPPPDRRLYTRREPYLADGYRKTREWAYERAPGDVAYYEARYDPPEGSGKRKRFHPWQQVSSKQWAMDEQGLTRILYRRPELRAAPLDVPVFIPEGEKCVEACRERGLVATTSQGGAGNWHRTPNARDEFKGRHVVIPADNDDAGRHHAEQVAQDLAGVAASVRILVLPGLAEHGDIYDWFEMAGGSNTVLRLYELVMTTVEYNSACSPQSGNSIPAGQFDPTGENAENMPPTDELAARRLRAAEERARRAEHQYNQLLRAHVTEDRILRQEATNDGDKLAIIANRRLLARRNKPEQRQPDGSLLVCYGGKDETTGRAYGLGALIGRSKDVAGDRARRLAGPGGAWIIERHDNWNGQFGVSRVTMRETWTGTHRPWTIAPNDGATRGKQGGKRVRICQNPLCRSPQLATIVTCTTCHTVQDGPPVYVDEADVNQPDGTAPALNSIPAGQFDPTGDTTSPAAEACGQVAPVWGTDTETGKLPPADCLDDSFCSVAGCGGELDAYDDDGTPFCLKHAPPQREAG